MTEDVPSYSIRNIPEIATEVGNLIMVTANLDCWMLPAMSILLDNNYDAAVSIMSNISNMSAKFDILSDIAEARKDLPLAAKVTVHRKSVREAIKFRNKVAHGLFAFDEDGKPLLIPYPLSKNKKVDLELTPNLIHKQVLVIGDFLREIHEITGPIDFESLPSR